MTCWDKRELCDLTCVFPVDNAVDADELQACGVRCVGEEENCVDSPETVEYIACASDCATSYDASLLRCNQKISPVTKGTMGANQDACSNMASGIMDDCMEACYGEDRFYGWTPDTEEGEHVEMFADEKWRHPFRYPDVVFGELRNQYGTK
ncbi:unnamed protein product [Choristocarpus tenellus]